MRGNLTVDSAQGIQVLSGGDITLTGGATPGKLVLGGASYDAEIYMDDSDNFWCVPQTNKTLDLYLGEPNGNCWQNAYMTVRSDTTSLLKIQSLIGSYVSGFVQANTTAVADIEIYSKYGSTTYAGLKETANSTSGTFTISATDTIIFETGGGAPAFCQEALEIDSSRNVKLVLDCSASSAHLSLGYDEDLKLWHNTGSSFIQSDTSGGIYIDQKNASGSIYLRTGATPTTRWEIDSSGNLLPGTGSTYTIGSTSAEVANIYMAGAHYLYMGDAQEAYLGYYNNYVALLNTGTDGVYIDQNNASGSIYLRTGSSPTTAVTIDSSQNATFAQFPITPSAAPDADYEVANKKYVDDTAGSASQSIANNDYHSFTPSEEYGFLFVHCSSYARDNNGDAVGSCWFSVSSSGSHTEADFRSNADIDFITGALNGSTGDPGNLTVSAHTDGQIYIENRLGATYVISWQLIALGADS
jgi:hypothetical protein